MVYAVGYMSLSIKLSENGGAAPEAVPYMPAGASEICATVNGAPGRRVVVADRAAAERLNADLAEKLQAAAEHRKARPLVMFDHNVQGGAAAVPVGFEWDDKRGILLRVEWTQAGREAVEGGNYGYVSPSFRLRPGSGEILGLADGVEVGSLVNDPAFERNECIAAGRADVGEDVVVHAANPYGCNQHGHEWTAEHGEGWGDGGQTGKSANKEARAFANMPWKEQQAKLKEMEDGANKAKKELRSFKKGEYSKAYIVVHGMDKEPDESDWKRFDDAENELRRLQDEADKANRKIREALTAKWKKEGGQSKDLLQKMLARYPEKVKATSAEDDTLEPAHGEQVRAGGAVSMLDALPPQGNEREGGESGYDGGKPGGVGSGNNQKKGKKMEEIAKLLGLPADADAATICAKITALKNQGAVDKKRIEEVEAEKEEHKKALTEHKHAAADAFMERVKKEGKVAPHDKERLQAARNMYLADPAGAECIFAGMKRVDNVRDEQKVEADKVEAAAARNYENLSLAELLAEENA